VCPQITLIFADNRIFRAMELLAAKNAENAKDGWGEDGRWKMAGAAGCGIEEYTIMRDRPRIPFCVLTTSARG
jgi:hypothetical protein